MNILIVHGYFLEGNGSNIYVRNLAKEIKKNGHRVIILSQESQAKDYSLVDRVYEFTFGNKIKRMTYKNPVSSKGECILIKPEIQGVLPVYKKEDVFGYQTVEFHKMKPAEIHNYTNLIANAVENILCEIQIDLIISTHLFPEPYIVENVRRKLSHNIKHFCIADGNCYYYSYLKNKSLKEYIVPAFLKTHNIIFQNEEIYIDIIREFPDYKERINSKSEIIPPGVDNDIFQPVYSIQPKNRIIENLRYKIKNDNGDASFLENFNFENRLNILSYGNFSLEKGIPLLIIVFPFIRKFIPEVNLYIAGFGQEQKKLKQLIEFLSRGMKKEYYNLLELLMENFESEDDQKNFYEICYLNLMDPEFSQEYFRQGKDIDNLIHFVGYMEHSKLSDFISLMDLCIFPIISKEGFSISVIEAMASGVPFVVSSNIGMGKTEKKIRDIYINEFGIDDYKEVIHDDKFLDSLIFDAVILLRYIKDNKDNNKLDELKLRLSSEASRQYSWFLVYENLMYNFFQRS